MKSLSVDFNNYYGVDSRVLQVNQKKLQETIQTIKREEPLGYASSFASLFMLADDQNIQEIKAVIAEKKSLHPAMMVVVGIGGSNLGMQAVYAALGYPGIPVYFADTIDTDAISMLLDRIELALSEGQNILLTLISKSGETTETIINASLFLTLLMRYRPDDFHRFVVVITEPDNKLWHLAQEQSWSLLVVPKQVVGRYSVLSAAGLFPLGMLDVAIDELVAGARDMFRQALKPDENNIATTGAAIAYEFYQKGYVIHDFFTFASAFEGLGKWYRQLLAESIGKEFTRDGRKVQVGITPTVSIGSTDLHSMVELHLGGPHNTFTTFVGLEKNPNIIIPQSVLTEKILPYAVGKSLAAVMAALLEGTERAYQKKGLPFMTVSFPERSARIVGQFLQWKMMEVIYLGALFNINCFDQPEVNLYKQEARAIIDHE